MKAFKWILFIVLLAGVAVLCYFRWSAWFGNPAEPKYEGDTIAYQFPAFGMDSVPGFVLTDEGWQDTVQPQVLRLVVLGDVHNMLDSVDYATIYHRHDSIDAYAQLGDWMERSYFFYQQQLSHQIVGSGMDQLPVMAVPGNHEYMNGIKKTLPRLWYDMFHNPQNGPERFLGSTYYVDFPRLRFIVMDTPGQQLLSDYTICMTWLKSVITGAGDRFTIVMMHHPAYSSSSSRFNLGTWMFFHPILYKANVVFAGHDHSYAVHNHFINTNSSCKVYKSKNKSDSSAAINSRLYQVVEICDDTLRVKTYSLDCPNNLQTLQFAPFVQNNTAVTQ